MKAIFKYYGPAILWALFIFTLCTVKLGNVEGSLFFPGFDKLVHCGFFFVLVVFYSNGFIRQHNYRSLPFKYAVIITAAAIVYGGIIELLQWKVFTWRDGDWNDLFADAVGACMGIFSILVTAAAINDEKK